MLGLSKRDLLARTLDVTGCGRLLRAAPAWRGVLVLNYHRIGSPGESPFDRHLWSATAEDFETQIATVAKHFDVIGLHDLPDALRRRRGRFVMITFDDGYRDNFSVVFPILKSHGVPATLFIATGFIDAPGVPWWDEIAWMVRTSAVTSLATSRWFSTPVWFDEPDREQAFRRLLTAYKGLGPEATDDFLNDLAEWLGTGRCPQSAAHEMWMTWDMIREMRRHGMTFGGHTVTHPILANLSSADQDWEVGECQRRLVAELQEPITAFSYPEGKRSCFNEFTRAALQHHGYRWAFEFAGGYCRCGHSDVFAVCRTAVETDIDLPLFRATVTLPQLFA